MCGASEFETWTFGKTEEERDKDLKRCTMKKEDGFPK